MLAVNKKLPKIAVLSFYSLWREEESAHRVRFNIFENETLIATVY